MREILFRAKRKNNGEWVEGSYHHQTDYYGDLCDTHYIINGTATDIEGYGEHYEIDPETLCQYTGLTDKNGRRIWENDIVFTNTHSYMEPKEILSGRIVYSEGWACWCIKQPDDKRLIPLCVYEGTRQIDRVVKGNVFDNPEFLERLTIKSQV